MKSLIFLLAAITTNFAWAEISHVQAILSQPEVQAAISTNDLISVTVNAEEAKGCATNYLVSAIYSSYLCSMSVSVDTCGNGNSLVGPLNCENLKINASEVTDTTPSFARDIRPIFQAKCTACHGSGKMRPNDYTNYATALANKDAVNQRVVVSKDMPMGGSMSAAQRDLVGNWAKGGAPK